MAQQLVERLPGWSTRLGLAALLLVFSEWVVWQTPLAYNVLEWGGLVVLYVALAAVALDIIARYRVHDLLSLLLVAGMYGLVNGTLISRITTRDLPLSLLIRPLGAQPLAFMAAFAAFLVLISGRNTGPLGSALAAGVGLVWGIWVRWFPSVSDETIPSVAVDDALGALGVGLMACMVLRYVLPLPEVIRPAGWRLTPYGWAAAGGVLVAGLVLGSAQGDITRQDIGVAGMLLVILGAMLHVTQPLRAERSYLHALTLPQRPNPLAWVVLVVPCLVMGWVGYQLPGSGDEALQSDILFWALTVFGVVWLPLASVMIGVRAFVQLAREQG